MLTTYHPKTAVGIRPAVWRAYPLMGCCIYVNSLTFNVWC